MSIALFFLILFSVIFPLICCFSFFLRGHSACQGSENVSGRHVVGTRCFDTDREGSVPNGASLVVYHPVASPVDLIQPPFNLRRPSQIGFPTPATYSFIVRKVHVFAFFFIANIFVVSFFCLFLALDGASKASKLENTKCFS